MKKETNLSVWFHRHKSSVLLYGGAILYFILLVITAVVINPKVSVGSQGVVHYSADFFGTGVKWYAIFILSGIIIAGLIAANEFKKAKVKVDDLYDGLLIFVPLAIVGARLFYVVFDAFWGGGHYNTIVDIIDVTRGGLAIHGAIITVAIGLIFFARKKKINYWFLVDVVVVGFLIGQIMGRWGNFMNFEAHGPIIKQSWIVDILPNFILRQMENPLQAGTYYHPTFLYEGIWNMIGLVLLLVLRRKRIFRVGEMAALYLIWYGIGRGALIEPLRTDQLKFLGIPVNIVLSLTLFTIGGIAIIIVKRLINKNDPYYCDLIEENGGNDHV